MLGGNVFGHFTDAPQTRSILDRAEDLGIRAVDTADVYSEGVSEEIIGASLAGRRSSWFVATKAGLRSGESPSGLGRKSHIFRKVEQSLRRLNTDYIDLYQLHHHDPSTPLTETAEAFEELKRLGWIRFAGLSNFNSTQLATMQSTAHGRFTHHQTWMNMTKPAATVPGLGELRIVAYAVLHRGLLSEKYLGPEVPIQSRAAVSASVQADMSPQFINRLRRSVALCRQHGTTITAVALQWVLRQPGVDWAVVGCRSPGQLEELSDWTSASIDAKVLAECEKIFQGQDE